MNASFALPLRRAPKQLMMLRVNSRRKGYEVRISGGKDKQGFPMKQDVWTHSRVHLLLCKGRSVTDQGKLGRGSPSLFKDALRMLIRVSTRRFLH